MEVKVKDQVWSLLQTTQCTCWSLRMLISTPVAMYIQYVQDIRLKELRKPLEVYQFCGSQHQCVHCAFKTPLKKIRHIPFHFPPDNDFLNFSFQITVVCRHILWDYSSVMFFSHSSQRTLRASKIKIQQEVLHLKSTAKIALKKNICLSPAQTSQN